VTGAGADQDYGRRRRKSRIKIVPTDIASTEKINETNVARIGNAHQRDSG
jgi:hypothetical protein